MSVAGESIGATGADDFGDPFTLPDEGPAAPAPRNYEQDANIAEQLTPEEQKKLCDLVIVEHDRDWKSGEKFRKRRAVQIELFAGILPEKPPGHDKIAQIHLSIIAQSVLILHATIHGQLFPPTNHIYGARAVTPAADERVRRLGLHMNWQVTTRIPEYLPANDRGMMMWLIYGTAFDCWYYDPIEQRPCYEFVHTDDLVMPYTCKSVRYDLSDVPRITRKLRKYQYEIEQLEAVQYYTNVERLFGEGEQADTMKPASDLTASSAPMQKSEDKIQGQDEPSDDPSAPRILYEQHRWYKLPDEDRHRPVIATVDPATQTLLRLVLREDEDPRDRSRYNRELTAGMAAHDAAMAQHQADVQDHAATVREMLNPQPEPPPGMMAPPDDGMGAPPPAPSMAPPAPPAPAMPPAAPEDLPPAPVPPTEPAPPAPVKMVPVHWFTKYGCIPNPEGIYDFGVGYLLEGDNIAADTLMSQFVSALTLSLFPTFFYSKQAKMQRGEFALRMGEGQEIGLPPDLLAKAFHQFQFPTPSPAVPKLIQQREEAGRQLVGASSILTGEGGSPNQTATEAQLRNSAARMNLAEMGNRFNCARQNSMKNLARLNAKTMDPVEYFSVTLPGQANLPPQAQEIARADYLEDFQITFHCDPRLASQVQRVQDALQILTQLLNIPPGPINPQAHSAAITMALVGYLRALERDDMAELIESAPPMPPPPMPGPQGPGGPGGPGGPPPGPPGHGGPPQHPGEKNGPGQHEGGAPGGIPRPHPGAPAGMGGPAGNPALPQAA